MSKLLNCPSGSVRLSECHTDLRQATGLSGSISTELKALATKIDPPVPDNIDCDEVEAHFNYLEAYVQALSTRVSDARIQWNNAPRVGHKDGE